MDKEGKAIPQSRTGGDPNLSSSHRMNASMHSV